MHDSKAQKGIKRLESAGKHGTSQTRGTWHECVRACVERGGRGVKSGKEGND